MAISAFNREVLEKFMIVLCPKCGMIQVSSAKTLKCKRCNKATKIFKKKGFGVKIFKSFSSGHRANKYINALKLQKLKQKEDTGFGTYTREI